MVITKSTWRLGAFVLLGLLLGLLAANGAFARGKKPPKRLRDRVLGAVPTEYGEFTGIAGSQSDWMLAFRNERGEVRLIHLRGSELPQEALLIQRQYDTTGKSEQSP